MAELEGEAPVAACLVDRARLDRVHGQPVDPLVVQHQRRVVQRLVRHDRETGLVEEAAAHGVRRIDGQRCGRGVNPCRRRALADEAEQGKDHDDGDDRHEPASHPRVPGASVEVAMACEDDAVGLLGHPGGFAGVCDVPLAVRPADERGACGDDRAADRQQHHQRHRSRTTSPTRRRPALRARRPRSRRRSRFGCGPAGPGSRGSPGTGPRGRAACACRPGARAVPRPEADAARPPRSSCAHRPEA